MATVMTADHQCVGFILSRGKLGFEAIDRDEKPIAFFATADQAAAAIMERRP